MFDCWPVEWRVFFPTTMFAVILFGVCYHIQNHLNLLEKTEIMGVGSDELNLKLIKRQTIEFTKAFGMNSNGMNAVHVRAAHSRSFELNLTKN